jgi:hypothetical protein
MIVFISPILSGIIDLFAIFLTWEYQDRDSFFFRHLAIQSFFYQVCFEVSLLIVFKRPAFLSNLYNQIHIFWITRHNLWSSFQQIYCIRKFWFDKSLRFLLFARCMSFQPCFAQRTYFFVNVKSEIPTV